MTRNRRRGGGEDRSGGRVVERLGRLGGVVLAVFWFLAGVCDGVAQPSVGGSEVVLEIVLPRVLERADDAVPGFLVDLCSAWEAEGASGAKWWVIPKEVKWLRAEDPGLEMVLPSFDSWIGQWGGAEARGRLQSVKMKEELSHRVKRKWDGGDWGVFLSRELKETGNREAANAALARQMGEGCIVLGFRPDGMAAGAEERLAGVDHYASVKNLRVALAQRLAASGRGTGVASGERDRAIASAPRKVIVMVLLGGAEVTSADVPESAPRIARSDAAIQTSATRQPAPVKTERTESAVSPQLPKLPEEAPLMLPRLQGDAVSKPAGLMSSSMQGARAGEKQPLSRQFEYDEAGRTTRAVGPGGKETKIAYQTDEKGRVRRIEETRADGGKVILGLDPFGRRVSMQDAAGVVEYRYDDHGRLREAAREGASKIAWTYDMMDRMTSVTVGQGFATRYSYDFLGRLAAMETPTGRISYEYQTGQRTVIRTLPNGVRTAWEYNPDSGLKSITHVGRNDEVLMQFTYSYRPDGRIATIRELSANGGRVLNYGYDNVQRLTSVADSSGDKTEYRYDPLGNRMEELKNGERAQWAEYDWAGRLSHLNGQDCVHDAAGNLSAYAANGGTRHFEFNVVNQIKTARIADACVEYRYDGDGNPVLRTVGSNATRFTCDPLADIWRPLAGATAHGKETFYVWDGNSPLVQIEDKEPLFFLQDHLGSVRSIVDWSGAIVEQPDYSAFGVPSRESGPEIIRPGFAGLFHDPASGIYLTRARGYDPSLGRFLQPDPRGRLSDFLVQGIAGYPYCGSDPVNWVDVNGAERQSFSTEIKNTSNGLPHRSIVSRAIGWFRREDTPKCFEDAVRTAIANTTQGGTIPILVTGVGSGWTESQRCAEEYYGRNAIGIRTTTGLDVWDWGVAFIDQTQNNRDHKVVWHVEYIQKIADSMNRSDITFDLKPYSDGTVTLRNESGHLDGALSRGLRINSVTTFGASSVENIANVCQKHGVRFQGEMNPRDPVVYLTLQPRTVSADLQKATGLPRILADPAAFCKVEWLKVVHLPELFTSLDEHSLETGYGVPKLSRVGREEGPPVWGKSELGGFGSALGGRRGGAMGEDLFAGIESTKRSFPGWPDDDGGGGGGAVGGGGLIRPRGGSPFDPGNVGGVYLRGAGEALQSLGRLAGVGLDEKNGRMVLLAEGRSEVGLPAMRLEDIVTSFRAVYEHGDAPYVSIDPDPKNPHGPTMVIRHGPGTANTYVGWVLFEADRVMKGYSLGRDNVTREPFRSGVEGYRSILETGFSEAGREEIWERFWIVPAEVNRRETKGKALTLLDVPLRVMTQRMELRKGEMVPAKDPTPSKAARQFAGWFTSNYTALAAEATSDPPRESGVRGRVAFFAELQRIALVTAIAERLRDQDVPFPAWMREVVPRSCSMPLTTPSITVSTTRTNTSHVSQLSIFGGVNLAAADKDVHTSKGGEEAEMIARALASKLVVTPALLPMALSQGGREFRAVSLPGNDTRALGACRLAETDLIVPIQRGTTMSLVRNFNSFFQPRDVLGASGWSLDMPCLREEKIAEERTGDQVKHRTIYQLTSPLNTWAETFRDLAMVPEVKGQLLVPGRRGEWLGLGDDNDSIIGAPTRVLLFRDGRRWHFDADGRMVASIAGPLAVVYRRDEAGRVARIEGRYGKDLRADITLAYDNEGRLVQGRGSNGAEASYAYGKEGFLESVRSASGKTDYEYADGLVAKIVEDGKTSRRFKYNRRGQLRCEWDAHGNETVYSIDETPGGAEVVSLLSDGKTVSERARYDARLRPAARTLPDGTQITWDRTGKGTVETITDSDGSKSVVETSADEKIREWFQFPGVKRRVEFDDAGRLLAVSQGAETVTQFAWHPGGQLAAVTDENTVVRPQYRDDGVMTGLLLAPPEDKGGKVIRWMQFDYDDAGRVVKAADSTGSDMHITYDKFGLPATWGTPTQDGKLEGVMVERDAQERLTRVTTSWRYVEENWYDESGALIRTDIKQDRDSAFAEYDKGRIVKFHQFDGGEYRLAYPAEEAIKDLPQQITAPNGLTLNYAYDGDSRLTGVTCGKACKLQFAYDEQGRLTGLSWRPPDE